MAIAFVFPGQGAQRVGMASDFLQAEALVRKRFEEANDALGFDLASIVSEGPASRLMETEVTQPALLTFGVALWQVWRSRGGAMPAVMAGHSLGEYTAFTAAGSMAFADAVRLVNARGRFMQEAVPVGEGAMAAILGLDNDVVSACCDQVDGAVRPANLNAPGQVVISGAKAAVESAVDACSDAGARRAMMLDVSAPFHSELMRPARDRFESVLDAIDLRAPDVPVVHNLDATLSSDPATIKHKLLRQVDAPVRWSDCVTVVKGCGVERLLECGPGNVLAGLVRRIDRSLSVAGIGTLEGMRAALE